MQCYANVNGVNCVNGVCAPTLHLLEEVVNLELCGEGRRLGVVHNLSAPDLMGGARWCGVVVGGVVMGGVMGGVLGGVMGGVLGGVMGGGRWVLRRLVVSVGGW